MDNEPKTSWIDLTMQSQPVFSPFHGSNLKGTRKHQKASLAMCQTGCCRLIHFTNPFFEHNGHDGDEDMVQGQSAVIHLARLYSSQVIDVVSHIHRPVGKSHEVLVGFVKVLASVAKNSTVVGNAS